MIHHNFHPLYRRDIDGLRALAILPVVAYHAFPRWAPGGFIGVDIFFVISGYLISLIIFKSLMNDDFSFTEFYTHRIKRIFPALILVLGSCYAFGWFALLPDEFKQLGKHIASGMGFVQNIILWKEAGYFDVASEVKPLMHLWSLAIEEQFYLVYPVLMWLAWTARLNVLTGVILFGCFSFALNLYGVNSSPVKTFFAPQTRFWELMAGSLLAYIWGFKAYKPSFVRWIYAAVFNRFLFRIVPPLECREEILANILSVVGFSLIVFSIYAYDRTAPYPGVRALAPVLGAVLLILAGPQALINRKFLSNKIIVYVGLISYPLYLWHWPLLSFAHIIESQTPSREIRLCAVVLSFILASLTYYLIEKPIRYGRTSWLKVTVLCLLAVGIGYTGYNAYSRNGLAFRVAQNVGMNAMFSEENTPWLDQNQDAQCKSKYPAFLHAYCKISRDADPTIQIIGDSHALALYPGMRDVFKADNVLYVGAPGCLPLANVATAPRQANEVNHTENNCLRYTGPAIEIAEKTSSINTVVLWFRGSMYLSSKGFFYDDTADGEKTHDVALYSINQPSVIDHDSIIKKALRETLDRLIAHKKNIIFVLDNAELGFNPKSCVKSRPLVLENNTKQICAIPRKDFDARSREYRDLVLSVLKDYPSVEVFDAADQLCDQQWCWAIKDGNMLYRDDDHLSLDGAKLLAGKMFELHNR